MNLKEEKKIDFCSIFLELEDIHDKFQAIYQASRPRSVLWLS
jgi:hypothetical protein